LESGSPRATDTVYALSAVDKSGRVADRSIVRVLGWGPGTRLDIREQAGIIVARPAADGVHCVGARGHLHLPLAVRRWCRLTAGDRVLLAAVYLPEKTSALLRTQSCAPSLPAVADAPGHPSDRCW
jgi:hypothetical protein